MSNRRKDDDRPGELPIKAAPADAGQGGEGVERTARGRFAPGQTGNRKGRPPKRQVSETDLFARVLDEMVSANLAGSTKSISMREGLVRSVCTRAFRDPNLALKVLELDKSCRATASSGEALEEAHDAGLAVLQHYVERAVRRGALPQAADDIVDADDDDVEEGS